MAAILQIGTLDVSAYVLEGYKVDIRTIYDTATAFTNMLGQEVADRIGTAVDISCTLGDVPEAIAAQICTLCDADSISITYATPKKSTATFKRPEISSTLTAEQASGNLWDITLSMTTGTTPIDGL